ncbi:hypothetical protein CPB83DRAFT_807107 [Crepidotus variabilis]|uniref:Uncharacterized protein n=1 Tax=Crepidotus variabilis TaxID=179855 RepID=A0A9P6ENW9_9AGAR|nr:hypothetical protein CPB83DRAFT_807107 [Crepidotus variabilis]
MSQFVTKASKTYGKRLFAQHLDQYTPQDPLYEFYTDERGVERRRKRDLPPGLSKRDAKILKSVKKRAHYLDKGFSICGMRFGWTFFISLIPIVGDVTDAALNYRLVVHKARKADIPPWLLKRMLFNNAVSAGVSLVPIVGDVVLAMYKANSRNAFLLEEFLRIRGEEFLKMGGVTEEEGKTGWLSSLVNKAVKGGVSAKDAEQVKPGAGMTKEELKAAGKKDMTTGSGKKRTYSGSSFGFFGSSKKNKSKTPPLTETNVPDKGRFVENVQ